MAEQANESSLWLPHVKQRVREVFRQLVSLAHKRAAAVPKAKPRSISPTLAGLSLDDILKRPIWGAPPAAPPGPALPIIARPAPRPVSPPRERSLLPTIERLEEEDEEPSPSAVGTQRHDHSHHKHGHHKRKRSSSRHLMFGAPITTSADLPYSVVATMPAFYSIHLDTLKSMEGALVNPTCSGHWIDQLIRELGLPLPPIRVAVLFDPDLRILLQGIREALLAVHDIAKQAPQVEALRAAWLAKLQDCTPVGIRAYAAMQIADQCRGIALADVAVALASGQKERNALKQRCQAAAAADEEKVSHNDQLNAKYETANQADFMGYVALVLGLQKSAVKAWLPGLQARERFYMHARNTLFRTQLRVTKEGVATAVGYEPTPEYSRAIPYNVQSTLEKSLHPTAADYLMYVNFLLERPSFIGKDVADDKAKREMFSKHKKLAARLAQEEQVLMLNEYPNWSGSMGLREVTQKNDIPAITDIIKRTMKQALHAKKSGARAIRKK